MRDALIKVRQLRITFGSKTVLDNIDFDVYSGETLAIIGPSGAGKSTIIRLLTGLEPPQSGSVIIAGAETNRYTESQWDELRKRMGVVFQYSALFDFLTVEGNVAFGLRRHFQLSETEIAAKVAQLLELVGMSGTGKMLPAELSGGMKKRVGLARALAMQPSLVLYDEPTSGLDPIMTMNISRLIRKTQQQLGVTSLLITHDMDSAFYAADRLALLYGGKIVAIGTVAEIKASENAIVQAFINGRDPAKEELTYEQQ